MTLTITALFGSLVFVPLFFQAVLGLSATEAGLRMAPLMGGLIVSSVLGGRYVTRTGRYKPFPVAGLAIATMAYLALAWAASHGVGANAMDGLLAVLGLGMGLVMPNVTTAVQNAVARVDLGVATATLGFFRSLGGAFGVAASGMILAATLRASLPAGGGARRARRWADADCRAAGWRACGVAGWVRAGFGHDVRRGGLRECAGVCGASVHA